MSNMIDVDMILMGKALQNRGMGGVLGPAYLAIE